MAMVTAWMRAGPLSGNGPGCEGDQGASFRADPSHGPGARPGH